MIVNGQHVFTFDGRHLTFPGNCRYVLAHDFVDRNFTVLMQMADGKPKALVLEDKNGNVIELKENGQVRVCFHHSHYRSLYLHISLRIHCTVSNYRVFGIQVFFVIDLILSTVI